MANPPQIDQIAERVEHLLLRHETLTHERDSLKSRLGAARARVDALLERLPQIADTTSPKGQP
ncbi:MAG: DUF904 domain-containing protein [Rhodoferax sp.]|nr:DUF904 domain-containing protein [Rhodoferax sp.]